MKRISWGTGIVIAIVVFVILVLAQTIFLMNQKVDLVEEDYYKKGIDFQKQIDKEERSNKYSDQIEIYSDGEILLIVFPQEIQDNLVSGEILLYRPSDSSLDMKFPIQLNDKKQIIPVSSLKKGFWRVKLNWSYNNNNYYKESTINF